MSSAVDGGQRDYNGLESLACRCLNAQDLIEREEREQVFDGALGFDYIKCIHSCIPTYPYRGNSSLRKSRQ